MKDLSQDRRQVRPLVVCIGEGLFGQMFNTNPSIHHSTSRSALSVLASFAGISEPEIRAVTMYFSPGAGEMIEIPTLSFGGMVNGARHREPCRRETLKFSQSEVQRTTPAASSVCYSKSSVSTIRAAPNESTRTSSISPEGPMDILQGARYSDGPKQSCFPGQR